MCAFCRDACPFEPLLRPPPEAIRRRFENENAGLDALASLHRVIRALQEEADNGE